MTAAYEWSEAIGQGAFGIVYKGRRKVDEALLAIKVQGSLDYESIAMFAKEAEHMRKFKHRSLVPCLDSFEGQNPTSKMWEHCIVMPRYRGDLARHLKKNGPLNKRDTAHLIHDVGEALGYLHGKKHIHRDVKPQNIMILVGRGSGSSSGSNDRHGLVFVLADFGLMKDIDKSSAKSAVGTHGFIAPDIIKDGHYTDKVDMWALGVTGSCAVIGEDSMQQRLCGYLIENYDFAIQQLRIILEEKLGEDLSEALLNLLSIEPQSRPSGQELARRAESSLCNGLPKLQEQIKLHEKKSAEQAKVIEEQAKTIEEKEAMIQEQAAVIRELKKKLKEGEEVNARNSLLEEEMAKLKTELREDKLKNGGCSQARSQETLEVPISCQRLLQSQRATTGPHCEDSTTKSVPPTTGGKVHTPRHHSKTVKVHENKRNGDGQTALFEAARKNDVETLRYLMETYNANVNERDNEDETPLFEAARNGHLDVMWVLVETYSANVNAASKHGETPLFKSARNGHTEAIKYLVEKGRADVNKKSNNDGTPLFHAVMNGHIEAVRVLVHHKAAISAPIRVPSSIGQLKKEAILKILNKNNKKW